MSQPLISRNADLKRLRDEGYNIVVSGGYLFTHHIPYVNSTKEIKFGILISALNMSGEKTAKPNTHVMMFCGEFPCNNLGAPMDAIKHPSPNINKGFENGIVAKHQFSNKPRNGYTDFYEKVKRYADIISSSAKSIDDSVTEKPFLPIEDKEENSVFNYLDTNSSRANIDFINNKLRSQKIGIVGLGGTGAYILDMVAKTHVSEIHIYDGDVFLNHNAFRSPGAATITELEEQISKVDYYQKKYSQMRKGIIAHNYYVYESNFSEFSEFDFVFICIDNNQIRKAFISFLIKEGIPFVDVGLGVNVVNDSLIGQIRVTSANKDNNCHLDKYIPDGDDTNNDYITNIQIAELNLLNAGFAVLKWKKMFGFYQDLEAEFHSTYSINNSFLNNETRSEI